MADLGTQRFSRTRRFDEEDRKTRIFDTKARIMGVDTAALDAQVDEKRRLREAEARMNQNAAEVANIFDKTLQLREQDRLMAKREVNREVESFRLSNQEKCGRRDYDLDDPLLRKKSLPARLDDTDENNPVSGIQKLAGEDLQAGWRKKLQMEQQALWAAGQEAQKRAARERALAEEQQMAEIMLAQDELRQQFASEESAIKAQLKRETADENRRLAEEKKMRERAAREAEARANEAEQEALASNPIINEHPDMQARGGVKSVVSPARYRKDHYKSMPEDQKQKIKDELDRQLMEKRARKLAEQSEEAAHAAHQEMIRLTLERRAAEAAAAARLAKIDLVETQKVQKVGHTIRETTLKKEVYTNVPTEAYFAQFNTRSR
ncbi:hypothetical protein KFL_000530430 [Klebsormidium nitens]|uniref:Uncharacterized protein n=1 Tax=Klebsormidium nitens TaxID=105231 RepID=A0A1Y1HV51_KLENI|nr:hypothetical protein KFL_000530430 [Klebsormidium nitens]|eukprot:GAQ80417.1 hypothetical protein KFL_000530430 [Klebsormidium nitens]